LLLIIFLFKNSPDLWLKNLKRTEAVSLYFWNIAKNAGNKNSDLPF
jgi:hypothetical protein